MALTLDVLEAEVRRGVPAASERWREALRQLAYYECRNAPLILPREGETPQDFENRLELTSKLTRKVIHELGKGLYNPGPTRELKAPGPARTFYERVCEQTHLNTLLGHADRMAWLHGVYGIQVAPGDKCCPVRLWPWRADEFHVWLSDDDPNQPWAVCCRSLYEARNQLRYQLWDATEVRTYWSRPGDTNPVPGRGERDLTFDPALSGPHGLGCLPFVFYHNEPPVCGFWTAGLGGILADTNHVLDVRLSDLDQSVATYCIPEKYASNVSNLLRMVHIPGVAINLVAQDPERPATVSFAQPELQVEEVWKHISSYANSTLLDLDLPLTVLPEDAHPESGVAIVARRMPLIDLWRARQGVVRPFECGLAKTVLTVAGTFWGQPGLSGAAAGCEALVVDFPEPAMPIPTPDADLQDQFEVEFGLKSKIQVLMSRRGCTRAQAIELLKRVAEDREVEESIMGPEPAPTTTPPAQAPAESVDEGMDPEPESESESDGEEDTTT